jgi:hypothetical protein
MDADCHPNLALDASGLRRRASSWSEPQSGDPLGRRPLGSDPLAVLAGPRSLRSSARSAGADGRLTA